MAHGRCPTNQSLLLPSSASVRPFAGSWGCRNELCQDCDGLMIIVKSNRVTSWGDGETRCSGSPEEGAALPVCIWGAGGSLGALGKASQTNQVRRMQKAKDIPGGGKSGHWGGWWGGTRRQRRRISDSGCRVKAGSGRCEGRQGGLWKPRNVQTMYEPSTARSPKMASPLTYQSRR